MTAETALRQPSRQIGVSDDHVRALALDVREASRAPAGDGLRFKRGHRRRRIRPSRYQLSLEQVMLRRQDPVAWLTLHVIAKSLEVILRPVGGLRAQGRSEALVRPLMPIHE